MDIQSNIKSVVIKRRYGIDVVVTQETKCEKPRNEKDVKH